MSKSRLKDTIVAGFAMFAMFFGAGNLIFPPVLGVVSGDQWFLAFIGFFLMDAGLAVLGVFTMINYRGDMNRVGECLGPWISKALCFAMVMCIGPCIAIPRTGAVTFSMGIGPILGVGENERIPLLVFSVIFYAIVFVLSIKPGKVIDIIGEYMTPFLLLFLLFLIVVGCIGSRMPEAAALYENPVREGITNGYQAMDGMSALLFTGMMIETLDAGRESQETSAISVVKGAGLMAGGLLFAIYGGLAYLGRVWGVSMATTFIRGRINQAELLTRIVRILLGNAGVYVLAAISIFACLTTAIGLTTASADYFADLVHHKISYKTFCVIICVAAAAFCNIGLNEIIAIAAPILGLIYPTITVLILLGLFREKIKGKLPCTLGAGTALVVSVLTFLCDTLHVRVLKVVHLLPLDDIGLGFALPTLLAVIIGLVIGRERGKNSENM